MPKFTQRTITDNVVGQYNDVAITKDGSILLPSLDLSADWRGRKRSGNVYDVTAKTVFGIGPILSAAIEPTAETTLYVANTANVFKGTLNLSSGAIAGIAGAYIAGAATRLAIDPTGTYLARANGTTLQIYNLASKALRATYTLASGVRDLEWSPDGVYLAAAPYLRIIKRTAANVFSNIGDIAGSNLLAGKGVSWHPDGDHIAVCSDSGGARPGFTVYARVGDVFTALPQSVFNDGGDPTNQNYGDVCYTKDGDYLIAGTSAGSPDIRAYGRNGGNYEASPVTGMTIENIDQIEAAKESQQVVVRTQATPWWKAYDFALGTEIHETGYLMTASIRLERVRQATIAETGFLMTGAVALKKTEGLKVAGLGYLGQMFIYGGPTAQIIANGDMLPMIASLQLAQTRRATFAESGYLMASDVQMRQAPKLSAALRGYLPTSSIQIENAEPAPPSSLLGGTPGFSGNGNTIAIGGGAVFFYSRKGITL